jgi:tRNA pseudouridine38-40 synthase
MSDRPPRKPPWKPNGPPRGGPPRSGPPRGGPPRGENRPRFDKRSGGDRPRFDPRGGGNRPPFDKPAGGGRPPFDKPAGGDRPRFDKRGGGDRPRFNPRGGGNRPPFGKPAGGGRPPFNKGGQDRPRFDKRGGGDRPRFDPRGGGNRPPFDKPAGSGRPPFNKPGGGDRPRFDKPGGGDRPRFDKRGGQDRPRFDRGGGQDRPRFERRDKPGFPRERPAEDRPAGEPVERPRFEGPPRRPLVQLPTGPPRNVRLLLEYEGTRYAGWQVQTNARTVMGDLLQALEGVLGEKPQLYGAGRTDQGVHAEAQVANFHTRVVLSPADILERLNAALPADINILRADDVAIAFHARHDASARRYRYQIALRRSAFFKRLVWWIKEPLDLPAMEAAARDLLGRHDFSSFSDRLEDVREPRVRVTHASWRRNDFLLSFTIEADHFLPRMVRRVVGVLVQIGLGRLPQEALARFLREPVNDPAQWTAPSSGLLLEKVFYTAERPVRS